MNASRLTKLVLVFGLGLMVASLVAEAAGGRGGGRGRRGQDPNPEDHIKSPFQGVVGGVAGNTITVKGELPVKERGAGSDSTGPTKLTIHFQVRSDTKLTRDGKPAAIGDIHPEDKVRVTFSAKEGSSLRHVTSIEVGKFAEGEPDNPKAAGAEKKQKKQKK